METRYRGPIHDAVLTQLVRQFLVEGGRGERERRERERGREREREGERERGGRGRERNAREKGRGDREEKRRKRMRKRTEEGRRERKDQHHGNRQTEISTDIQTNPKTGMRARTLPPIPPSLLPPSSLANYKSTSTAEKGAGCSLFPKKCEVVKIIKHALSAAS